MAKFPHLPLWTDAYMADTLHLSHEEHGLYLMLLMTIWRSPDCKIPNDLEWVKRRLRATDQQMENLVKNLLDEFFTTTYYSAGFRALMFLWGRFCRTWFLWFKPLQSLANEANRNY